MAHPTLPALRPQATLVSALLWPGLAAAHVIDPSAPAGWSLAWSFDPVVVGALAMSLVLYACGFWRLQSRSGPTARALRRRHVAAFAGGWATLVLALVSPLDALGAALFSAHMVQHELLMLVAAPLLVLGRPLGVWMWALPAGWRAAVGVAVRWRPAKAVWGCVTAPLAAWLLHAAALWLWHAPRFFQAALLHPWIHTLQHTSFLVSALLFWWSIFGRRSGGEAGAFSMLSLFTTMVHTGALGALLALAPGLWYPLYVEPSSALGFDPLQDQQMGGLVMWVPGGVAYLVGALVIAARWLVADRPAEGGALLPKSP
ncbi:MULTISPECIES: cytochrome c oxidase assembly protein [unclassified Variovorax]|uniref:cytochrome c oxidase assembly protein n=1 Tax=unclassified Variovorax TaxID=663243 RepID=UPI0008B2E2E7|nr:MULTISPECIES: cytochrome c oxidase assembly protein [unclassified Variovorax]SEK17122.1 Cytochrome c oxidase assembly factor CtaG [Variovorax sp. OK202]SFE72850.1 Cytochrome c oxidase assembly factor CtaG [Variovorax sp. OK212]